MPDPATVFLGFTALALGASAVRGRKKKREAQAAAPIPEEGEIEGALGPEPDECLVDVYSQQPQYLIQEALQNLTPQAQGVYTTPVYYIQPEAQGIAFTRLAYYKLNEPDIDPVLAVAGELAPGCNWSSPQVLWSSSMFAFTNSLEKMLQVISIDTGPIQYRKHAWELYPALRNGMTLRVPSGTPVAFDDTGLIYYKRLGGESHSDRLETSGGATELFFPVPGEPDKREARTVVLLRPVIGSHAKTVQWDVTGVGGTKGTLIVEAPTISYQVPQELQPGAL